MASKRVIVCGGRNFDDRDLIYNTLNMICLNRGWVTGTDEFGNYLPAGLTIITGGARGADQRAEDWAIVNWVPFERYEPEWKVHGKKAGILRNIGMLEKGADLVVAFPGGRGTAHMVKIAEKAGVPVFKAS